VGKETLLKTVWPDTVDEGSLTFQVSTLRKALGESGYIVTVPGRGYQLATEVMVEERITTTVAVTEERRPVLLIAAIVVLCVAIGFVIFRAWPSKKVSSLAVLPFKPLVAANRDAALELGMADTLIAKLWASDFVAADRGIIQR